ncbi:MAG: carbamoyl-phosphate synthase large subunit [bacterium]|nr:MAG: Carbamoyl-phosphate synthase large chain [bacterium 42_11]MDK2871506.1 carbamoyl-phosphate synthase large subunit [bacterium]
MPKRTDIKRILIIGSGPIVIGQACEFDYSGSQACKALKEDGFEVVLVNSNPATIMTDPEMADRTYIEPIVPEVVEKIIAKERPDAILPTLGGQTALNTAIALAENGVLEKYGVEMIGVSPEAIKKAESRELFKKAMERIGLRVPKSGIARSMADVRRIAKEIGFPIIVRPSFTLGGTGGGVAYSWEDLEVLAQAGLSASMVHEVLLEESVLGWKEYELEVMRDKKDNVVIICSIENFDPMGVHTGDSITVAPAQTLTDKEYQKMRDAAIAVIREIGVETGGSNIQFALNPENGEMMVIEMNPRVSRSSALASKATGFPIAKIAAKLAVGYTLDEIPNDITRETYASFEPTIDYCVVKIPRWDFKKFPGAKDELGTSMRSVGEVMAIGRTFKEALQKAVRSLEIGRYGLGSDGKDPKALTREEIEEKLSRPNSERLFYIKYALQGGFSVDEVHRLTKIDPWFLNNIKQIVDLEEELKRFKGYPLSDIPQDLFKKAKSYGFSDRQLACLWGRAEEEVRRERERRNLFPVYKLVDTCAAEFEAYTPYYYSTYEIEDEAKVSNNKKVIILGGGPNRIGQGIEFDYCCVHASFALREEGIESIIVNSNPETVSTDYDTSDRLYFDPLTLEDVLHIVREEKPWGVIVQFGGQTPLNLALPLYNNGVPIIGTSPLEIERAENRDEFREFLYKLGLKQAPSGIAFNLEEALKIAEEIGYPVLVRPSYVLGGRAMEIVYNEERMKGFFERAIEEAPGAPVLIDKFLEGATEVDVDAVADGEICVIAGVMEHIEEAGIHSGDSACVLPPHTLPKDMVDEIKRQTRLLARELNVVGLINVQYAVKDGEIYVLEVNPRASRTIPFVSKATGIPWAKIATKVMIGKKLRELGITEEVEIEHVAVKEAVLPFSRFPGVDPQLGPEMRSTGEVMGIDYSYPLAYAKAQIAAGMRLPREGKALLAADEESSLKIIPIAQRLLSLGFTLGAFQFTASHLKRNGIPCEALKGTSKIRKGEFSLIIGIGSGREISEARRLAVDLSIPYATTVSGAKAMIDAIEALRSEELEVRPIQEYYLRRAFRFENLERRFRIV